MASKAQKPDESGSKRQRMERSQAGTSHPTAQDAVPIRDASKPTPLAFSLSTVSQNEASENPQLSLLDKTDLALSEDSRSLYNTEPLEKVLNGDVLNIPKMNKEIMTLLSKYANVLSERAAMETSYVQELDEILTEASDIENDLKQKRESLKQRFTVMANSLQG